MIVCVAEKKINVRTLCTQRVLGVVAVAAGALMDYRFWLECALVLFSAENHFNGISNFLLSPGICFNYVRIFFNISHSFVVLSCFCKYLKNSVLCAFYMCI